MFLNGNRIKKKKFNARFYSEFDLPITIHPNVGFTTKGYLYDNINAKSGDTVIINISFIQNNKSEKEVIVNEIDYVNDCFEIFNQGDENVSLDGWQIIDKNNNIYTITDGVLKKGRFLVFHNKIIKNKIDSVDYLKIGFKISGNSELLRMYDNKGDLVDSVSYNLTEIKNSYSRNIPFENVDRTIVNWENNSDVTIGFHNASYRELITSIQKRASQSIDDDDESTLLLILISFYIYKKKNYITRMRKQIFRVPFK